MRKFLIFILFISVLFTLGCQQNIENSDAKNTSSTLNNSNKISEDAFDISKFDVLGTFICSDESFKTEFHKKYPSTIPLIAFYEAGTCHFRINYSEGMFDVSGFYTVESNNIKVKLNLNNTIFMDAKTGEKYMDDQYVFTIMNNNKIVIDRECYAVNSGDLFVKHN